MAASNNVLQAPGVKSATLCAGGKYGTCAEDVLLHISGADPAWNTEACQQSQSRLRGQLLACICICMAVLQGSINGTN
jgi:hypothetical protein